MRREDDESENMLSQRPEQSKVEYMAEHVMQADESLSHVALQYYGSAVRDKWMLIYEANKEAIGPDPAHVRPGTVLKIPRLPRD